MKIFLLEYITAGGFNNATLSNALLQEALLMRDALLRDFSMLDDVEIITTYDARLAKPNVEKAVSISSDTDVFDVWNVLLSDCDAALILAPETGYVLMQLTQMLADNNVLNLGCKLPAVLIASNKLDTFKVLKSAGILTIQTCTANAIDAGFFESGHHGFILKPIDGAGCENTFYFQSSADLKSWLTDEYEQNTLIGNLIIQPYIVGQPASISALFKNGEAWVLGCNPQKIWKRKSLKKPMSMQYAGSVVNGLPEYAERFNVLANKVAAVLPDLNGYAGIDVIVDKEEIYVVEINPRITTSYVGLHESLSVNPAALILSLTNSQNFRLPENMTHYSVDINLNA